MSVKAETYHYLLNKYAVLLIVTCSLLVFAFGLGNTHLFDWDEINFAEASREMLLSGDWLRVQINYEPFWEKPPLFFWLQASAMSIFGVGEMAARLPNALCGALTLVVLFLIGKKLVDRKFAWFWVLAYAGSMLPFLYFKSGIIDPWFNLFIFLSLYFLFLSKDEHQKSAALWGGIFAGLAVLTKGPVGLLLIGGSFGLLWLFAKGRWVVSPWCVFIYGLMAILTPMVWFGLEIWQNGTWFVEEFIKYQWRLFSTPDAGHKGFPGFHIVVLFVGCFPASIFAIKSLFSINRGFIQKSYGDQFQHWMACLFFVVLFVFSIVESKIIHYSSLAYFPITFFAATVIYKLIAKEYTFSKSLKLSLWLVGSLWVIVMIATPVLGQNINVLLLLFESDLFAQANLQAEVNWTGWETIPGLLLLWLMWKLSRDIAKDAQPMTFVRLFIGNIIVVSLVLFFYINKIEAYSQHAAVEFFEDKVGEDADVITYGYKSYAHLFYSKKMPPNEEQRQDVHTLLNGKINRPVYVATKINKIHHLEHTPDLEELYRKNGFVFFVRWPVEE